jgi:hypothetical protein
MPKHLFDGVGDHRNDLLEGVEHEVATRASRFETSSIQVNPQPTLLTQESRMTFLQHLGSTLRNALHIGEQVAVAAEPVVAIAFPQIVPLYQTTLGLATGAEAMATATTGTGPQKLSQLVADLLPQAQAWAAKNNIDWPEAEIQKWASAVVDTVNLIPAPKA